MNASAARRVAFVINSLEGGGAERVMSILLAAVHGPLRKEAGFDAHLILLDERPRKYPVPRDMPVHVVGADGATGASVRGVVRLLRALRPAAALSFLTRANLATVAASLTVRTPSIISERVNPTSHFAGGGWRGAVGLATIRATYPLARRVIAVSGGVADELTSRYGVARRRVETIHNPYDLSALRAAAAAPAPSMPWSRYYVAVGRLTANKNMGLLLDAFAAARPDAGLAILGEGEERAALEARATALGVADRVRFMGFLDAPHPVVAGAVALLSTSNAEGFPNAPAEAMALGRPVALTDCPSGPAELLEGRAPAGAGVVRARHGLLTPTGDLAAMAEAIRQLENPALAADYGARAAWRMEDFSALPVARRYLAAIHAAIGAA